MADRYLADNRLFKANTFFNHINKLRFCKVNAHNQNRAIEQAIKTVSNLSRSMMPYTSVHWKDGINSYLWPMATTYAAYVYNHFHDSNGIVHADLFPGSQFPQHQ